MKKKMNREKIKDWKWNVSEAFNGIFNGAEKDQINAMMKMLTGNIKKHKWIGDK